MWSLFQVNFLSGSREVQYKNTVLTGVKLFWLLHIQLLLLSANVIFFPTVLLPVLISIRFLLMYSNTLFHYAWIWYEWHFHPLALSSIYLSNWYPVISGTVRTVRYQHHWLYPLGQTHWPTMLPAFQEHQVFVGLSKAISCRSAFRTPILYCENTREKLVPNETQANATTKDLLTNILMYSAISALTSFPKRCK